MGSGKISLDCFIVSEKDVEMKKKKANASIYFLARKYLAGRSALGISRDYTLTLIGITLGVVALITVSSVMNGFREDISGRIIGTLSELRLSKPAGALLQDYQPLLEKLGKEGFTAAPVARTELLLRNGQKSAAAVVFGIDPYRHKAVSPLLNQQSQKDALHGILAGELVPESFSEDGIALGSTLAGELGLYIGDEVQLISLLFNQPTPFGLMPMVRKLKVKAIFAAGMPEYDQSYSYVPLPVVQAFNSYDTQVDYLEIRSKNPQKSRKHLAQLSPLFPGDRKSVV